MATVKDIRDFLDSTQSLELDAAFEGRLPKDMNKDSIEDKRKVMLEGHYAYDVLLRGKNIDTVFYSSHEDPEDVKRSLVNHDGYDPAITVKLVRAAKTKEGVDGKVGGPSVPCTAGAKAATVGSQDVSAASELDALGASAGQSAPSNEGRDGDGQPMDEKVARYAVTIYTSKRDMYGNAYGAVEVTDLKREKTARGNIGSAWQNARSIYRHWDVPGDFDRSLIFYEKELPIREFNALTKGWPYIGSQPEEMAANLRKALGLKDKSGTASSASGKSTGPAEGRLPKDMTNDTIPDKMKVMLEAEAPTAVIQAATKGETIPQADSTGGSSTSNANEELAVGDPVMVDIMGGGGQGVVRGFGRQSKDHVLVEFSNDLGRHWVFRKFLKKVGESAADITKLMKKSMKPLKGKTGEDQKAALIGKAVTFSPRERFEKEVNLFSGAQVLAEGVEFPESEEGQTYEADAQDIKDLIDNEHDLYDVLQKRIYPSIVQGIRAAGGDVQKQVQSQALAFNHVAREGIRRWKRSMAQWMDDPKSVVVDPAKNPKLADEVADLLQADFNEWWQAEGQKMTAESLHAALEEARKSSTGEVSDGGSSKAGFDLTAISPENWASMLLNLGIRSNSGKRVNMGSYQAWQWEGDGIKIVTAQNPINGEPGDSSMGSQQKEIGYASYIGIEGEPGKVKMVVDFIKANGQYKDFNPNQREFI